MVEARKARSNGILAGGDIRASDKSTVDTLQTIQLATFIGGLVITALGVVDAITSRPDEYAVASSGLAVGPGTVTVRW